MEDLSPQPSAVLCFTVQLMQCSGRLLLGSSGQFVCLETGAASATQEQLLAPELPLLPALAKQKSIHL